MELFIITLEMMALTFIIGFVVAGVIKLIARSADSLELYSTKKVQMQRLARMKRQRERTLKALIEKIESMDKVEIVNHYYSEGQGASDFDLMDYYYPRTARLRKGIKKKLELDGDETPEAKVKEILKETKKNKH